MLVYQKNYLVIDINEGSLLYPTIYTLHLNNLESEILLDFHHTYMYLDYVNRLNIKIYNNYEEYAKGLYRICGVIKKINNINSNTIAIEITYSGLRAYIQLPSIYKREFMKNGILSIIMNVKR